MDPRRPPSRAQPRSSPAGADFDPEDAYLSAGAAAERLGVKRASLYSYASRGLVRSVPAAQGRARLYSRADVERLRARHDARAGHGAVAASALRFGEPVLDSAITEIVAAGPRVRGHLLVELVAQRITFERTALLLWTGALPDTVPALSARSADATFARVARLLPPGSSPLARLALLVPALAVRDLDRFAALPAAEQLRAAQLIKSLAAGVALPDVAAARAALATNCVAAALARATGARRGADVLHAIDAALVLSSDHELNASTFCARIAASTGADLYACFSAGLAALSGPRHGGGCDRVEALVSETGTPRRAASVVRARARRGDALAGFGHPLYPAGDPRTPPLLALGRTLAKKTGGAAAVAARTLLALVDAAADLRGEAPTLDLGLVVIALASSMAPGSASAIFGIGRAAGWTAHVIEQRDSTALLRPRARFRADETQRVA